jgi:hypothetical protein
MTAAAPKRRGIVAALAAIGDGAIIRAAFFAMLAGTAAVLYIDYRELTEGDVASLAMPDIPVLPAFNPDDPMLPGGPVVTTDPGLLRQPLTIELGPGGVLSLTGSIDPGSFERVQAELEARGEYVKQVALNSPGGSVVDAVKIGALMVAGEYSTAVAKGALCASSCPLILAGGKERQASRQSAIGVHQIYAMASAGDLPAGLAGVGTAMSEAQRTTAVITRYLNTTGVDPAMWLHALETPPSQLYYLSSEELTTYRLVTQFTD